jgi:hypothetical protein
VIRPSGYDHPITYDDRMTTSSFRSAVLRNGVVIGDPLGAVLGFATAYRDVGVNDPSRPASFDEPDLRLGNRDGARISAAQIAAILERRRAIEQALEEIAPQASLTEPAGSVPWLPLGQLFGAFAGISGVGFSKMTKVLYRKRPALIPILDSIVQKYLEDDDLGTQASFGERALEFVHGYKHDLDHNQGPLQTARQELARRGYELTEVRILDLLILYAAAPAPASRAGSPAVRGRS